MNNGTTRAGAAKQRRPRNRVTSLAVHQLVIRNVRSKSWHTRQACHERLILPSYSTFSKIMRVQALATATLLLPPTASCFQRSPPTLTSTGNGPNRRSVLFAGGGGMFGGMFSGVGVPSASATSGEGSYKSKGPTNEVVKTVTGSAMKRGGGMKRRRLGGSDILVSELGLGTQRWVSADYNAPDEADCFAFMDEAILRGGVNLIDTAEQYPIPSDGRTAREGDSEKVIGKWMRERKFPRSDIGKCFPTVSA